MIKRNLMLFFGLFLLIAVTGTPVLASGNNLPIHLKFAGAFSNNVVYVPDPENPTEFAFGALAHVLARGFPGRAVVRSFGAVPGGPPSMEPCYLQDSTPGTEFPVAQNPIVLTFVWDNSLLYGTGPGEICVDFTTGRAEFEFRIAITGGRGYFQSSTGHLVLKGESEPVGVDLSGPFPVPLNLNAETGTIKGVAILQ